MYIRIKNKLMLGLMILFLVTGLALEHVSYAQAEIGLMEAGDEEVDEGDTADSCFEMLGGVKSRLSMEFQSVN